MLVIISGFRQKIGPNINYAGVGDKHKLIAHHEDSFIYVIETVFIENMKDILTKAGRDFDVLEESLGKSQFEILEKLWLKHNSTFNLYIPKFRHISGALNAQFYLESHHLVSDRTVKKINKATNSMMESGFFKFYMSMTSFTQKLIERAYLDRNDDEFRALEFNQLRRPLILLIGLWGFTTIILMVEIIVFKWNNRRRRAVRESWNFRAVMSNLFPPYRTILNALFRQRNA